MKPANLWVSRFSKFYYSLQSSVYFFVSDVQSCLHSFAACRLSLCLSKKAPISSETGTRTRLMFTRRRLYLGSAVTERLRKSPRKIREVEKAMRRANSSRLSSHACAKSFPTLVKGPFESPSVGRGSRRHSCAQKFLFHDINSLLVSLCASPGRRCDTRFLLLMLTEM